MLLVTSGHLLICHVMLITVAKAVSQDEFGPLLKCDIHLFYNQLFFELLRFLSEACL